jgi:glycine cleavage system H lipoate-binding protein
LGVLWGEESGIVESNKTASDLHAPVDGLVLAVNEALVETPDAVNDAPYEQWIFKLQPAVAFSAEGFGCSGVFEADFLIWFLFFGWFCWLG